MCKLAHSRVHLLIVLVFMLHQWAWIVTSEAECPAKSRALSRLSSLTLSGLAVIEWDHMEWKEAVPRRQLSYLRDSRWDEQKNCSVELNLNCRLYTHQYNDWCSGHSVLFWIVVWLELTEMIWVLIFWSVYVVIPSGHSQLLLLESHHWSAVTSRCRHLHLSAAGCCEKLWRAPSRPRG